MAISLQMGRGRPNPLWGSLSLYDIHRRSLANHITYNIRSRNAINIIKMLMLTEISPNRAAIKYIAIQTIDMKRVHLQLWNILILSCFYKDTTVKT